jgi:hypothetical protein
MLYFSDLPVPYVKSDCYCTAALNVLKLLEMMFRFALLLISCHERVQLVIVYKHPHGEQ